MTTKTIVNWGGFLHCVEVSDGLTECAGVRIFRCDNNGEMLQEDRREVFVDPHEMIKDEGWNPDDVLLVHVYRNPKEDPKVEDPNEEGIPVTIRLRYDEILLSNDGKKTLRATNDVDINSIHGPEEQL